MADRTPEIQDSATWRHWAHSLLKGGQLMPGTGAPGAGSQRIPPPQSWWVTLEKPNPTGGLSFLTCMVREWQIPPTWGVLMESQDGHHYQLPQPGQRDGSFEWFNIYGVSTTTQKGIGGTGRAVRAPGGRHIKPLSQLVSK